MVAEVSILGEGLEAVLAWEEGASCLEAVATFQVVEAFLLVVLDPFLEVVPLVVGLPYLLLGQDLPNQEEHPSCEEAALLEELVRFG